MKLTHLDENGAAHMVNIGAKPVTQREAVAQSVLTMQPETLRMILDGTVPKGDVFACARIAGIMAAKRTAELIPMCHPIPIESVDIAIEAVSETQVRVVSTLRCSHKTGIEMEALTAASVAALTVYDAYAFRLALGELHGQLVILQVIAPAEHAVAAARLVLEHTCMPQLAAARLYCTAARYSRSDKLCAHLVDIRTCFAAAQRVTHRFDI